MTISIGEDFAATTEPFRRELFVHCYRMLGSVHDAEDLLQETMLRAWRAQERYDAGRASLRTWLYRIATNACLTALEQRSRRPLPSGLAPAGRDADQPLIRGEQVPWLEPVPDTMLGDPAEVVHARGSLRLALIAAMQHLPPKQRAVLIMREALSWPAADVAAALEMTPAAVNSAMQRAKARLGEAALREDQIDEPEDAVQREQVERYAEAFELADLAALEKLLAEDVALEMPPFLTWFTGRETFVRFMARVYTLRGTHWRTLPTRANGQHALATYVRDPDDHGTYVRHSLQVFGISRAGISHAVVFQDQQVFALFGMEPTLPSAT